LVLAQSKVDELYGKDLKDIRIKGLRYTQEEIMFRELASKVGKPYTETNAQKDFAKLDKLDIFSSIEIQPFEEGNDVNLEIRVKELFPYLPFFSYEVTDENGFAGGPGFQSVNLLGRDRFLFGAARFGGATNISVLYEDPWIAGNHLSVRLEFSQRDRFNKLDEFNEIASEGTLRIGSYLGEYGRVGGRFSFISLKSDLPGKTLSSYPQVTATMFQRLDFSSVMIAAIYGLIHIKDGGANLNFQRQAGSSVGMAISGHLILTSDDMCQLSKSTP